MGRQTGGKYLEKDRQLPREDIAFLAAFLRAGCVSLIAKDWVCSTQFFKINLLKNFFFHVYLFLRERETERERGRSREREGDTESEAGSGL